VIQVLRDFGGLRCLDAPVAAAFGVFDGLHRGHCRLIKTVMHRAAQIGATPIVITFDPHPLKVLTPESAPRILMALPHKLRVLSRLGVKNVAVMRFDRELACMTAEDFIAQVAGNCQLRLIGVGHRWAFGHKRAGNVALLQRLGQHYHFEVLEMDPVCDEDGVISSTRVRQALREGRLDIARQLLGRDFSVFAPVVKGDGRGSCLGFPTVNLQPESEKLPPPGVYAGWADLEDGTGYPAAVHHGARPTVGAAESLEAHLVGFRGDLLGQYVELHFKEKIRDIVKFRDVAELAAQIRADLVHPAMPKSNV
jgi:riboflavin kinase/FMN adenylyltransferase